MSIINDVAELFGKVTRLQREVKKLGPGGGGGGDSNKIDTITLNGSQVPIINKEAKLLVDSGTVKLDKVDNTPDKTKPVSDPTKTYIENWYIGLDSPDKAWVEGAISLSLDGQATEAWVLEQSYVKATALNGYATQTWVNAQGFLKANALVPYSTTVQMDAEIAAATTGMATQSWVNTQGFLKSSALSAYSTTIQMNTAIATATNGMATQTWVTSQNYLKSADVSNKVDKVKPSRLSYALANPDGTLNTTLPTFGNISKVLGVDATGLPVHNETVEEYVIDNTVTELTLQDLVSKNAEQVVCPNLMRRYYKMGNKWGYCSIIEVTE